ncbi:hypothetical protein ACVCAH_17945 [Micromonospora sp. LZ34]
MQIEAAGVASALDLEALPSAPVAIGVHLSKRRRHHVARFHLSGPTIR